MITPGPCALGPTTWTRLSSLFSNALRSAAGVGGLAGAAAARARSASEAKGRMPADHHPNGRPPPACARRRAVDRDLDEAWASPGATKWRSGGPPLALSLSKRQ